MELHKPMIVAKQTPQSIPPVVVPWQKESVGKDVPIKQEAKESNPYFRKNN